MLIYLGSSEVNQTILNKTRCTYSCFVTTKEIWLYIFKKTQKTLHVE
jgi:hypothetical protein